jgi:hypothetical protein
MKKAVLGLVIAATVSTGTAVAGYGAGLSVADMAMQAGACSGYAHTLKLGKASKQSLLTSEFLYTESGLSTIEAIRAASYIKGFSLGLPEDRARKAYIAANCADYAKPAR